MSTSRNGFNILVHIASQFVETYPDLSSRMHRTIDALCYEVTDQEAVDLLSCLLIEGVM